jgi:hypothetical protein
VSWRWRHADAKFSKCNTDALQAPYLFRVDKSVFMYSIKLRHELIGTDTLIALSGCVRA